MVSSVDGLSLKIIRSGDTLYLEWDSGTLEKTSSLNQAWESVSDAKSPHPLLANEKTAFYRLHPEATFELKIEKTGAGSGRIISTPAGLYCGISCSKEWPEGSLIVLTAEPESGSVFAGWDGAGCSGTDSCAVLLDAAKHVTARFEPLTTNQVLVNGGFEEGWESGWTQEPDRLIYPAQALGIPAYSGEQVAWLGWAQDERRSATLWQEVTLPAVPPIYLNMAIWIYSEESCDVGLFDGFGFYINGEAIVENPRLCQGNTGGDGWRRLNFDLSPYAGLTVILGFEIWSVYSDPLASVVVIDDLSLDRTPL